jgi:uncharacterized membrane protein HdeD (DUF308 family)
LQRFSLDAPLVAGSASSHRYGAAVDKSTLLWTLVVFFGASIVFRFIRRATEDQSAGVTIVLALAALGLMVGAITAFVKWRDRR